MSAESQSSLSRDPAFLQQKMQYYERTFYAQLYYAREDLARERSRYRQLESKLEEFQAYAERSAARRLEDAGYENVLLRYDLETERARVGDLQKLLYELGQFAGERVQLTRRLEIADAENADLQKQLNNLREKALADQAKVAADATIAQEQAVSEAIARTRREMDANISQELKLLREQNVALQRGILALKKVKDVDFDAQQKRAEEAKFDALIDADLERNLYSKNTVIKQLQMRAADAEARLDAEKKQVQVFFRKMTEKCDQERLYFTQYIRSLEKLVYIKCKELYRLRTLAALILQKRTDLEHMLYRCMRETVPLGDSAAYLQHEYPRTMREMQRSLIYGVRIVPAAAIDEIGAERLLEVVSSWVRYIDGQDV